MTNQGVFGYIIGRKKRLMHVEDDANLLWQLLVREIYVLMKHFKTIVELKSAFEKIVVLKKDPTEEDKDKYKMFSDFSEMEKDPSKWNNILRHCQNSFINMLETGVMVNQKEEYGYVFILDFNKETVEFYNASDKERDDPPKKEGDKKKSRRKENNVVATATLTLEEIPNLNDMPIKSYPEIIVKMTTDFNTWYAKYSAVREELTKLRDLKQTVNNQGASNIEDKVDKLIDEMECVKYELFDNRRVFYGRLKMLNLIEGKC